MALTDIKVRTTKPSDKQEKALVKVKHLGGYEQI